MIQLHFAPSTVAMVSPILLEDIGVARERVLANEGLSELSV